MITSDEKYMQRCLQLAKNGGQDVAPNPMVGCVIVHKGKIIGEGYHRKYGEAHAEVNAIKRVENQEVLKDSTLYVNLEPCAHHGKTPPCSDLIVEKQIPRVVIGSKDINSLVAGKGIERMQKAGIEVVTGILEEESKELNKRFFTFHAKKRPYVILKWAETIDGYIDIDRSDSDKGIRWITHPLLRVVVHKWRSEESGIMVGTKTAENDDPGLDTRLWSGKSPLRFVIDRELKLPRDLKLFDGKISTVVFTGKDRIDEHNRRYVKIDFSKNTLGQMLREMYEMEIQSLIVEGGASLLNSFIKSGLWDEARVFVGNKTFGGGVKGPVIAKPMTNFCQFGQDRILYFHNR